MNATQKEIHELGLDRMVPARSLLRKSEKSLDNIDKGFDGNDHFGSIPGRFICLTNIIFLPIVYCYYIPKESLRLVKRIFKSSFCALGSVVHPDKEIRRKCKILRKRYAVKTLYSIDTVLLSPLNLIVSCGVFTFGSTIHPGYCVKFVKLMGKKSTKQLKKRIEFEKNNSIYATPEDAVTEEDKAFISAVYNPQRSRSVFLENLNLEHLGQNPSNQSASEDPSNPPPAYSVT